MNRGKTAVYRCFSGAGDLLYVGIGRNPFQRFKKDHMHQSWFRLVDVIDLEWFPQRCQAKSAETVAIEVEQAAFNVSENKRHRELTAKFDLRNLPNHVDITVKTRFDPDDLDPWDRRISVSYDT